MRAWARAVLAALAVTACATPPVKEAPAFSEPENGEVLSVEAGGRFTVALSGNVTTGYVWSAGGYDEALLTLLSDDYRADPAPEGLVGSGGMRIFTFLAANAGETELVLTHARHADDVAERRTLSVQVEP